LERIAAQLLYLEDNWLFQSSSEKSFGAGRLSTTDEVMIMRLTEELRGLKKRIGGGMMHTRSLGRFGGFQLYCC
jgi:hypothetical protein